MIFHLAGPYPPFLSILARNNGVSAILDREWCIEVGDWDGQPTSIAKYYDPTEGADPLYYKMNGTGPYMLTEWVNGERTVLTAFENYCQPS